MMEKRSQTGLSPLAIIVIIAVIVAVGAWIYASQRQSAPSGEQAGEEDEAMMEEDGMVVVLAAQNDSGQNGAARLTEDNGRVRVVVELANSPQDVPQPAHIHAGSCPNPAAVVYPLANVVNGQSETTINASFADLANQLPLAINVHKSPTEIPVYVACGDLPMQASKNLGGQTTEEEESVTENDGETVTEDEQEDTVTEEQEQPAPSSQAELKIVSVTGAGFAFSPTEIRVKRGERVRIDFQSLGGFHDWTVEGYNVGTAQVNTGQSASVEFTADQAGTFEFYCSVPGHRAAGMVGTLIVE